VDKKGKDERAKNADERRTASAKHDAQFFKDRKAKEARNLELTLKLRTQRLAHEATQPEQPKRRYPAARRKPGKSDSPI
jgi:hypothetical protein